MNDPKELIVKIDAIEIRNLVSDIEDKFYPIIKKLQEEIEELRAHIERWAENEDEDDDPTHFEMQIEIGVGDHYVSEGTGFCGNVDCQLDWPCPTEVAKGWSE